jgi:hypothetical protein
LGKEPINSEKGGLGFYFSEKLIKENNRGSLYTDYNNKNKEFSVILEFIKKG